MTARSTMITTGALALVACAPASVQSGGSVTGAVSARAAVEQFLGAVRAGDIQGMTVVFGTASGPARDAIPREELEQRTVIMQCFLAHDQYRVLSELPYAGGRRVLRVQLTRGTATRETSFFAVPGPRSRWYVENVDLAAIRDFCGEPLPGPRQ